MTILNNKWIAAEKIPNYFKDPASLNYGVIVSWKNPMYRITKNFKFMSYYLSLLFKL